MRWLLAAVDDINYALEALSLEVGKLYDASWLFGEAVLALFCAESPYGSEVDDVAGCPYAQSSVCLGAKYQAAASGDANELDCVANDIALCSRII